MNIKNISTSAIEMLTRVQEVFPGTMLGGSSVYAPREGEEQDWDFFIPTDLTPEEVAERLIEAGFDLSHEWAEVTYANPEGLSAIRPAQLQKQFGLQVVRRPGDSVFHCDWEEGGTRGRQWDFVLLPSSRLNGKTVAEWMTSFQPILQQALMTDGKSVFNADYVDMGEVTVNLSNIRSMEQLEEIRRRAFRLAEAKYEGSGWLREEIEYRSQTWSGGKKISFVGSLSAAMVEVLLNQRESLARGWDEEYLNSKTLKRELLAEKENTAVQLAKERRNMVLIAGGAVLFGLAIIF